MWKQVYIPLLFFSGVDYIDAPTPYMMGLHSGVDTSTLAMDGVSSFQETALLFIHIRVEKDICSFYAFYISAILVNIKQLYALFIFYF